MNLKGTGGRRRKISDLIKVDQMNCSKLKTGLVRGSFAQ